MPGLFSAVPWDKILELITTLAPLIISCFKKEGRAGARDNMRNPGPFQKLRLRRELRRQGMEDQFAAVLETLESATDEELDDLINEAHEVSGLGEPNE